MSGKPSLVISFEFDEFELRPRPETLTLRVENAWTPGDRTRLYDWIVNSHPEFREAAEAAGLGYLD